MTTGRLAPAARRGHSTVLQVKSLVPLVLLALIAFALCLRAVPVRAAEPDGAAPRKAQAELLRLGERLYREGILPSGKPVEAVVQGDLAINGRQVSCANCHGRSGLGSVEGGIVTPANAGCKLFQPSYYGREFTAAERGALSEHYQTPARRPAYNEMTLAAAIRIGVDPTGKALNPVMPRFKLNDSDMAILVGYLKSLSAEPPPCVSETSISFATVFSSDAPAKDRDEMLGTLEAFVADWNSQAPVHEARARYPELAREADLSYRRITLKRWQLDGPPATWRSQLEAYYAKDPVFGLLGGITSADWRPIHEFSEERHLPCIFPLTELPVVSGTDWYTMYLSKGLYQEGEAAAASIGRALDVTEGDAVVQLFRDTREGRALAAGFEAAWRSLGRKPPVNLVLGADAPVPQEVVRRITGKQMPQVLVLWLGSEAVPLLEAVAAGGHRPKEVYLSTSLLGPALWTLSEPVREFASFTYPYSLPQDEAMHPSYARVWLLARKLPVDERRISTRMYSLMLLLNDAIPRMKRNYYRDNLLEQIDRSSVHGFPDYDRLSFGPGQRYASKQCHIVTLSRGPNPILLKKGD